MPTTEKKPNPTLEKLPDGHRLWYEKPEVGMPSAIDIFIIDDSGASPSETRDGPCRLDTRRPLRLYFDHTAIPIVSPNGAQSGVASNPATILALAARFNWPILTEMGDEYMVAQV